MPFSKVFLTALSNTADSFSKPTEYYKAIQKLNIVAIGLAIFFPSISGADQ